MARLKSGDDAARRILIGRIRIEAKARGEKMPPMKEFFELTTKQLAALAENYTTRGIEHGRLVGNTHTK